MNQDTKETLVVFVISSIIGAAFMWASLHKVELYINGNITLTGSISID